MNIISEDEYIKTSENGFEIIEKQTENTSKEVIKPAEDVRASSFVDPMVNIAREINPFKKNEEEVKPVGVPEDLKTRIAFALADTSLPSKSPLPSEDSFTYLTSRNYLSYFGVVSSVLIFAMTLFDV